MTPLAICLIVACFFCIFALVMTLVNLRVYSAPTAVELAMLPPDQQPLISVCIPARNEAANIEACVRSILSGMHRNLEVLVYNDHSTDSTGEILSRLIAADPRVRAVAVLPLEHGWNGKQFACHQLGSAARGEYCLFTDADVRFEPHCLAATLNRCRALSADLLSTFPLQRTHTLGEALVIPMIHFILFSYLPMPRMRSTSDPAASAGCGQFLFVRRSAYLASGGHAPFKDSMHDGIKLPRTMRKAGYRTDLFDGTSLVSCRMYRGFTATWRGFAKNAFEGLGSLGLLTFITVVHLLAHLLPWCVLIAALAAHAGVEAVGVEGAGSVVAQREWNPLVIGLACFAILIALSHRFLLALRFRQRFIGALLHPLGVLLMTLIQWHSFYLHITKQRSWKGRTTAPA